MPRKTKDEKIRELEEELEKMKKLAEFERLRAERIAQQTEEEFLNSMTYQKLKEEKEWYKNLADTTIRKLESVEETSNKKLKEAQGICEEKEKVIKKQEEEIRNLQNICINAKEMDERPEQSFSEAL